MTRDYRNTLPRKVANIAIEPAIKLGLAPGSVHLLATRGRKTGTIHVTPVNIIEDRGCRWLVAPYGEVDWVKNVRANPRVQLRRGSNVERLVASEVGPEERGAILQDYLKQVPVVRPFVHLDPDDPIERFITESTPYPVFRLVQPSGASRDD